MKAMLLAAGLGKRMRPLTDNCPKPLLKVGGKALIEYHLESLAAAGFQDIIVNTHWCGDQIPKALGDGSQWGLHLSYSHEEVLLETAGGIRLVLDELCQDDDVFFLINGDIYCDFNIRNLAADVFGTNSTCTALIGLVPNPAHNTEGDFALDKSGQVRPIESSQSGYTYAGIGWYHRDFFQDMEPGPRPLGPELKTQIASEKVKGFLIEDYWVDVGTPERLEQLDEHLRHD